MSGAAQGERALIDAFLRPFARGAEELARPGQRSGRSGGSPGRGTAAGVLLGPGSDCAVLQPSRGQRLVVTTDAVLEGVHFDRRWFSPEDIGHKALAVNLSDLAAAGSQPRWFVCALGVPRQPEALRLAAGMARGMAPLARRHGCALVGGNVSAAAQWSLTITALGEARRPLDRAGGRPGDALVVVGTLGDAAAGLRLLRARARDRDSDSDSDPDRDRAPDREGADPLRARDKVSRPLRQSRPGALSAVEDARPAGLRSPVPRRSLLAQLRPAPLVEEGLAAAPLASAAIDVSDGLLRDLCHLCEQSGCGAAVDCDALPVGPLARREADALDLALTGGEDYALLLAVRPRRLGALLRAIPRAVEVGRLRASPGISLRERGAPRPLPRRRGFDHLD